MPERGEGQEVAAVVERDARSREMTRKGRDGSGEKDGRACFACSWGGNVYFLLGGGDAGVYNPLCSFVCLLVVGVAT